MSTRFRLVVAVLLLSACNKSQQTAAADSTALPPGHVPIARVDALPAVAQAAIDSANKAYSAKDYTGALALYRNALAAAPGHPAPWYGIAMVASATGDSVLADSAQKMVQAAGAEVAPHPAAAPTMPRSPH